MQPEPLSVQNDNHEITQEQVVEKILRAEKFRRGRGWVRRILVKWKGFAEPNWENRSALEEVVALDKFEAKFGKGDGVGEEEGARQGKMIPIKNDKSSKENTTKNKEKGQKIKQINK